MRDVLVLGSFVFDDWSTPERLPSGGAHRITINRTAGGGRTVDAWGPDDRCRAWQGKLVGADALDQALALDAMRVAGEELPYSNGIEARTVIITEFEFDATRPLIEYRIKLETTDDSGSGLGGGGGGVMGLDAVVGADLAAAFDLVSDLLP